MAFVDLVLFAVIAVFLGYRLWSLLGTHSADRPIRKRRSEEEDVVIPIRAHANPRKEEVVISQEVEKPQDLNEEKFLKGAAVAFRKIVEAYAEGNLNVLEKLLEGPLLTTFEDAITKRKKAKENLEVDIARITKSEVIDKREEGGVAFYTVRFVSEQCLVTKSTKGKIIAGDPDRYAEVTDIWTFSRPLKNSDPNWKLVATQLPE